MDNEQETDGLTEESEVLSVIEGEFISEEGETLVAEFSEGRDLLPEGEDPAPGNQKAWLHFFLLPLVFLTVTLLGGLRIAAPGGEFIFVTPALSCLIFATLLMILFLRTGLISIRGWFSESITTLGNVANGAVLLTLFAASVQMFNSLIPEGGLPYWIVAFCFLWTLGVSVFTISDARKLVYSIVALFSFAFLTKYFVLLSLTSKSSGNWLQRLWADPTKEAITYLLDLPRYSPATGYIQFFAAALFLLGLFLVRPDTLDTMREK